MTCPKTLGVLQSHVVSTEVVKRLREMVVQLALGSAESVFRVLLIPRMAGMARAKAREKIEISHPSLFF